MRYFPEADFLVHSSEKRDTAKWTGFASANRETTRVVVHENVFHYTDEIGSRREDCRSEGWQLGVY